MIAVVGDLVAFERRLCNLVGVREAMLAVVINLLCCFGAAVCRLLRFRGSTCLKQ